MDYAKWPKIKETVFALLDLPENECADFLAQVEDEEIRREVEILLSARKESENFIETPFFLEKDQDSSDKNDGFIGQTIDNYRILERIGTGGMGAVYLAERLNSDFKQKVALKIIKRGMDSEAILKRFANERRILSTLRHPNIAQLLDGGISSDGLPFFVMEFVDGQPLNQFCQEKNLSLNDRLAIFRQISQAVEYAHRNLVIHRDLKPSNILVNEDGMAKLLDFGIAKLLLNEEGQETVTATEGRVFTPEYASPEQILGKNVTTSTDVYSLGVILYELLCGHRPFETKGKSFEEIVKWVCETPPTKPSLAATKFKEVKTQEESASPSLPLQNPKMLQGDLDNIILKALEKEATERYGSVPEFSEDIRRFLAGLPILARPQTFTYRFGKYVRRNKLGTLAAATILLSLIGGISATSWQAIEVSRQRAKTERSLTELRKRARELMNETNQSLVKLNGSLEVRTNLVEKSIAMLDSIALEKPDDIEILQDLAAGYELLGRKQNFEFREFENSIRNLSKAVEIRRQILADDPANLEAKTKLVNVLISLSETFLSFGKTEELFLNLKEREKLLRELYDAEPENIERLDHLTTFYLTLAEFDKESQNQEERKKNLENGLTLTQELLDRYQSRELTAKETQDYAYQLSGKGIILNDLGRADEALVEHEKSAVTAQKAWQMDKNLNLAFNLTIRSQRYKAEIYRARKQFDQALEMYQVALNRMEIGLAKSELNKDGQLKRGYNIYQIRQALMLEKTGRKKEAAILMKAAYGQYLSEIEQNKDESFHILYFYEVLPDVAEYYLETKQVEKAAEVWEGHARRVQFFLSKNPEDILFQNYLTNAYEQIGDVYAGNGGNKKKAGFAYQKAVENDQKIRAIFSPNQSEIKKLQDLQEKIKRLELE